MHGPRQSGNKVERQREKKESQSFSLPYNTRDTRITPRRRGTPPLLLPLLSRDLRSRSREFLETVEGRREKMPPFPFRVERLLSRAFDLSGKHSFSRHTIHALGRFSPVYLAIKISLVFDRPRPDGCIYFSMYDLDDKWKRLVFLECA